MTAARILLVNLLLGSLVVGAAALILEADALWPFELPLPRTEGPGHCANR
ncbi:MAG: hypothetical protein HW376_1250 [candidate division NC10 bacterium]|nr:hypothetical protein [candidate division NC10 bacterium]